MGRAHRGQSRDPRRTLRTPSQTQTSFSWTCFFLCLSSQGLSVFVAPFLSSIHTVFPALSSKRKSELGGKKSTNLVTFCQWWSWPLNSLKDGGWNKQLHTCAHMWSAGLRLYTWWTSSLLWLWEMSLIDLNHCPPAPQLSFIPTSLSERTCYFSPQDNSLTHPEIQPRSSHLFQLLSRKGHAISPPRTIPWLTQRSSQYRIKQLLDSEEHPWCLQDRLWEDSLRELDHSYI